MKKRGIIIILSIVLFLIFLLSWNFFLPGVNYNSLYDLQKSIHTPQYIKIFDFFRAANLANPKLFSVGIFSVLFASLMNMISSLANKNKNKYLENKKTSNIFIGAYIAGCIIALLFFIIYLVFLGRLRFRTSFGFGIPIIQNPGVRLYIAATIIVLVAAALIFLISFMLRNKIKNPLNYLVVVICLLLLSKFVFGIPFIQNLSYKVIRLPYIYLDLIVSPPPSRSIMDGTPKQYIKKPASEAPQKPPAPDGASKK